MKMTLIVAASILAMAGQSAAMCVGGDAYQHCYDGQSGNSYSVQRYGNTTMMQGRNSRTGTSWSQDSYSNGGGTSHYGRDSNGNRWSTHCYNGICN